MTSPRFEGDDELERVLDDLATEAVTPPVLPGIGRPCALCLATGAHARDADHEYVPLTPGYELDAMLEHGRGRALWRFGRKLQELAARDYEYVRYLRMVREEVERERARIKHQMAALDDLIAGYALEQREQDEAHKSLHIPGVGTWTTRKVGASWRTEDEAAVLARLEETPDEFMLLTEPRQGRDLIKDRFKTWLADNGFEAFPGMTYTPEHVAVKGPFQ